MVTEHEKTRTYIAFWGILIIANVFMANNDMTLAGIWLVFAVITLMSYFYVYRRKRMIPYPTKTK